MMHNKVHIAKLRSCCDVWCAGMPVQGKWSSRSRLQVQLISYSISLRITSPHSW